LTFVTGPFCRLGALRLSILSTVLMFVVLPVGFMLAVAALALAGGSGRRTRRYRPGRPYDFAPIWFLARPEQVGPALAGGARAQAPAISSGVVETGATAPAGATGGASDRW
jgi:hypothetical protein